jgi:hypothetical protein
MTMCSKGDPVVFCRSAFWTSLSLDELVEQQRLAPVTDFGVLDSIWSEGEVFDNALPEVLQDHANRRGHSHVL